MIDVEVQTDRIEGGNTSHLISIILLTSSKLFTPLPKTSSSFIN